MPMLAPKRYLIPQQPIRDTQVLQLSQEFIQRVMLIVVAAEVFQRIPERVVRRTHQAIQRDQWQGENAQTLALHNELAALEQRHARVVLAFALVLHGGKALRADLRPAVIGSRELSLAVAAFAVAPHSLVSIRCGPAKDRKSTRLNSSHSQISYAV